MTFSYYFEKAYPASNMFKGMVLDESIEDALFDFPILTNVPYGKSIKDIDNLIFFSKGVIVNENKNLKPFIIFYSWFVSHILNRYVEGVPIAQYYARTVGYPVKCTLALTISNFKADASTLRAIKSLDVKLIENGKQLLDYPSSDMLGVIRAKFLSVINIVSNVSDVSSCITSTIACISSCLSVQLPKRMYREFIANLYSKARIVKAVVSALGRKAGKRLDSLKRIGIKTLDSNLNIVYKIAEWHISKVIEVRSRDRGKDIPLFTPRAFSLLWWSKLLTSNKLESRSLEG